VIFLYSIINITSASYYSDVNLHGFMKTLYFAIRENVHQIWHFMLLIVVLSNVDTSVKILSTSSTIFRSRKTKVFVL